jgi:hypothetical protein
LDRLQLPSGEFPSPAVEQPMARMDSAPGGRRRADPPSQEFRPAAPEPGPRTPEPWEVAGGRRAEEPARTAWEDRPVAGAPQAPESDRWFAAEAEQAEAGRHSGGRRRRAEPDPQPMRPEPGGRRRAAEEEPGGRRRAAEEESGGRRRRAEETPSWQELATWDPVVKATRGAWTPADGSHARGEEGSHATGHSVADLLAQHGTENPRRRRRRED